MESPLSPRRLNGLVLVELCSVRPSEIASFERSIQFRRDSLERCTRALDGLPLAKGGSSDRMATLVGGVVDLERDRDRLRQFYAAELLAATCCLERLPEVERRTAELFYLDRASMPVAARTLGYSISSVKRFLASAKSHLSEITEADVLNFLPDWYSSGEIPARLEG